MNGLCKCERCGRIAQMFQYTYFDTKAKRVTIQKIRDNGKGENPRYSPYFEEEVYDESRGLCEECAVEVNKKSFDNRV